MGKSYRVVVGVDGSEGGQRALAWAVQDAAERNGTVQAVLVWEWNEDTRSVVIGNEHGHEERNAEQALTQAIAAVRGNYPDVPITAEAVRGHAAPALTAAARDADLLVLGSHGHGRLFHAVLGSVAAECVRAATCPVVVVPAPRPQPTRHEPGEIITTATY